MSDLDRFAKDAAHDDRVDLSVGCDLCLQTPKTSCAQESFTISLLYRNGIALQPSGIIRLGGMARSQCEGFENSLLLCGFKRKSI